MTFCSKNAVSGKTVLTGLVGAVAVWLGFPNDLIEMPPLALLWPVALTLLGFRAASGAAALRTGWICGLAGSAAALYWISLPVHNVGGLPWPLAVPCAILVAACLASANGFYVLAAYSLRRRPPLICAATLALAWYLLEDVFSFVPGFPWLPLAGALAAWPVLVQAADIFGAYVLSGLWVLAALLCLVFFNNKTCLISGLSLTAALLAYGFWRLEQTPYTVEPAGPQSISVLFVDGDIDQNQKWIPAFQQASLDAHVNLTRMGLAAVPPGEKPLIVWPETAMPFFFERMPAYDGVIRDLAAKSGCPLLLGAPALDIAANGQRFIYNRAFLLSPLGIVPGGTVGRYNKMRLVPFGEYLPKWLDVPFLANLLQNVGVYEEGMSAEPLRYGKLALGMILCYETIFQPLARDRVEHGANVLVDLGNHAWFGRTPAVRQHLCLSALRSVEQGRWLLRGTNAGLPAVIDSRGRLTVCGGRFQAQTLFARAALATEKTIYALVAPWILPVGLAAFVLFLFVGARIERKRHPSL
ncbi:MAG: apolipoprotein N-acyltransferase [Desulfovibrio sp.]|jgi:apolipoprotein N-acyltransferase|nr:apolipoprotein N-acyltransferase [Desulfovibrio sp.]